jgi:heat shock protein beta
MKSLLRLLFLALFVFALVSANEDAASEDAPAAEEEEAVPSGDPLSPEQRAVAEEGKETLEFQAEVSRLMDIIINSLYSNREIFLRELISNAADAIEKIRTQALSNSDLIAEGDELDIKIKFDKEAKTLSLTDSGVGMTKDDLIKNLGIVAKSGTTEFLDNVGKNEDSISLIGQFGVGFYSVYLVAERVTVVSKHNDDDQHIWESNADRTFTVVKDPRGNTMRRGTEIILHLKEDAEEFLDEHQLEKLVGRYSSFINFPIYMYTTKTVEEEVPIEEDPEDVDADADAEPTDDDDLEVGEEQDGDADDEPKTKTVKKEVSDWRLLNTAKAIWTRNPADISDEEYGEFYQSISKDHGGYLNKIHFTAEGEITFRSVLFIPKKAEHGMYDKFYEKSTALKLYVRRVLISDQFEDFLPRYLSCVKGVVDSEDLPLNVSRETLAQSRVLKVMGKKLTRKVLGMLRQMAEAEKDDEEEEEEKEEQAEGEEGEEAEVESDKKTLYSQFWNEFGKSIKLGVIDDRANKSKLTKLLRYSTSKSEGKLAGLEDYVDNMLEGQKYIYYITGESVEAVEKSPMLETLVKRGYEVLYMVDALDEYVLQSLAEFDGHELMSVTKEGLKFGDEAKEKAKLEKLQDDFKPLTDWLQEKLTDEVTKVTVSNRLGSTPAVLVTGQYGWSANMERIMKAQTFADPSKQSYMASKKTLEINPRHPAIKSLAEKVDATPDDAALVDLAKLIHDAALVTSGFQIDNGAAFAQRINRLVALGLDVDPNAEVEEEVEEEPAAEEDSNDAADAADALLEDDEPAAEAEVGHDEL